MFSKNRHPWPIVQYVIDLAKGVGSLKTYIVLGYKSEEVRKYIPAELVVINQKKQLGTADAVKSVERQLSRYRGDVLILSGDAPLLMKGTLKDLISKHKKTKAACTVLSAVVHNPQGYGRIIRDTGGKVVAIREDKDASGFEKNIAEINTGVYCFNSRELFKGLKQIKLNQKKKEFYLTDIIELLATSGFKVESLETEDVREGLGINTREDVAVAQAIIRARVLKEFMLQGVTIVDPATTYIDADVKIGKDTVIQPFSVIEKDVKLGARCSVGPFARIRSGSKIGNDVQVGNFTEISRSKIGGKTFMKHFSFLGDSIVGASVNIGAGVVTANFDGKNKNVTHISDQAFIGSDSVLIAPVKIGKKAVVAAGSVVTRGKNVPDNALAIGVPAKIEKRTKSK